MSTSTATAPGPLRVAYLTMLFPAGSETFASLDVRELMRKGLEVEVHSFRPKGADSDRLAQERGLEGVTRTYNGPVASLRGLGRMLARPGEAAAFTAWLLRLTASRPVELLKSLVLLPRAFDILHMLRMSRPDVVHVYWGHYPSLAGALVQRYLPDTLVSMSLGAYDLEARYPATAPVARNALFVRTHGLCNVPELVERVGVAPQNVAVVFNGIDLCLAPPTVPSGERIGGRIVTAGRLIKSKAVDEVLVAFAKVRERVPEATLEIFGDGPERLRLEDLARLMGLHEAVSFRGHTGQRRLFEALSHAEVFLFMSRNSSERLPNVLKEAMACGAVCVTTDSVGLDELIPGPRHGRVVALGDVGGAANEVVALLGDPSTMEEIRVSARSHVVESFDVRRTTDAYVSRWGAAVAVRRGAGPSAKAAETA